jgi:hypothetical protein
LFERCQNGTRPEIRSRRFPKLFFRSLLDPHIAEFVLDSELTFLKGGSNAIPNNCRFRVGSRHCRERASRIRKNSRLCRFANQRVPAPVNPFMSCQYQDGDVDA